MGATGNQNFLYFVLLLRVFDLLIIIKRQLLKEMHL